MVMEILSIHVEYPTGLLVDVVLQLATLLQIHQKMHSSRVLVGSSVFLKIDVDKIDRQR